jgi:hypothetical protein
MDALRRVFYILHVKLSTNIVLSFVYIAGQRSTSSPCATRQVCTSIFHTALEICRNQKAEQPTMQKQKSTSLMDTFSEINRAVTSRNLHTFPIIVLRRSRQSRRADPPIYEAQETIRNPPLQRSGLESQHPRSVLSCLGRRH